MDTGSSVKTKKKANVKESNIGNMIIILYFMRTNKPSYSVKDLNSASTSVTS